LNEIDEENPSSCGKKTERQGEVLLDMLKKRKKQQRERPLLVPPSKRGRWAWGWPLLLAMSPSKKKTEGVGPRTVAIERERRG
jgi:hypothetical protein